MKVDLQENGRLTVHAANIDAQQAEELIQAIAAARARMAPAVPADLQEARSSGIAFSEMQDPTTFVSKRVDGAITMLVRHGGIGWLCLTFDVGKAGSIGKALLRRAQVAVKDWLDEEVPRGRTSH